ncbi:MAG: DMT family transporter [Caldilineaceae bacterium]|nr:DMT family transporter [Caldilineaceae bacterium]
MSASATDSRSNDWIWYAAALAAHTGWGIYPALGRYMQTVAGLPSMSILVIGGLPMLVLMLVYVLPRYGIAPFRRNHLMWAFALVVAFRSITNLVSARFTLSIYVQLIALLTPFIVVLLSRVFLKEKVPSYTLPAITLSVIGSLLVMSSSPGAAGLRIALTPSDWLGISMAAASSIGLAVYMLIIRRTASSHIPGDVVLIFQTVVIMLTALLLSLLLGEDWSRWATLDRTGWTVVGAYIVCVIFGANGLQITALRHLGAPTVSTLMPWRLISALIIGNLLLNERLESIWQALGAVLVLGAISWYLWQRRKDSREQENLG